jgi:hypothetical protein
MHVAGYLGQLAILLVSLSIITGCGSAGAPYVIDKRPLPTSNDLEVLVPRTVG